MSELGQVSRQVTGGVLLQVAKFSSSKPSSSDRFAARTLWDVAFENLFPPGGRRSGVRDAEALVGLRRKKDAAER